MKALAFACLILLSLFALAAPVTFHARLDQENPQELTWTFSKAPEGWGKKDLDQVKLSCDGVVPAYSLHWSNGQTLKLSFATNLHPGVSCITELALPGHQEKNSFNVPKIKILDVLPWDFTRLEEDSAFIVSLEAPIDPKLLADEAYVEVEGLGEKIELDAVSAETKQAVLKSQWMEESAKYVVLKPRRTFPQQKNVVFVAPGKLTFPYRKQGTIREPFRITVSCERPKPELPCSPLSRLNLEFSSPVKNENLREITVTGAGVKAKLEVPEGDGTTTYASAKLKLDSMKEYTVNVPQNLTDADGRKLANAAKFPLTIKTGDYPPLAKFPGPFGILEAASPVLPVTVRNVEKEVKLKKSTAVIKLSNPILLMQWRKAIADRQGMGYEKELRSTSVFAGSPIKLTEETLSYGQLKNQSEVLGLPLKEKGLHLVELSSDAVGSSLLATPQKFYVSTAVLVTDLAAHLKVGKSNSFVWVTSLSTGTPVEDAEVVVWDCLGRAAAKGRTSREGFLLLPNVTTENLNCTSQKVPSFNGKLLVTATKKDDTTFTLSDWSEGIETWRFGLPWYSDEGSLRAHTVFDRPVYKQGEKVHMLHLLRSQLDLGLTIAKKGPGHARLYHYETNKEWKLPLKWKDLGTAATEFVIPENAPQGTYQVSLVSYAKGKISESLEAGSFRVKEFRIPLMRSELAFADKREAFLAGEAVKLLGHLEFLAGGAASETPVTLRTEVNPVTYLYVEGWDGFSFTPGQAALNENSAGTVLEKQKASTDKNGAVTFTIKDLPKSTRPQNLFAEIEYLDPNGVYQTNSVSATVYPYPLLIGVKGPPSPKLHQEQSFSIVTLDQKHRPQAKRSFRARLVREITSTVRKKILGGFYSYDSTSRLEELGEVCSGVTGANGIGTCKLKLKLGSGGRHYLVVDAEGSLANLSFWAYGDGEAWEDQTYHDRLDLIADKKEYVPGDVAKLELKLPFEKGTVLVTKERVGIREAWITNYSRQNPFITVPVKKEDFPNTYVSVFVVRGRLAEAQATGLVDLGRPAYRMGLTELKVKLVDSDLKLSVVPEKEVYQVRDKVKVRVSATTKDGTPLGKTKVALSVFDEGLLLFGGQYSFDVHDSLIKSFNHQVSTSTAQTHVIGKRHFGLKARPEGGGGGRDLKPRELFDTLLYWNPEVELNAKGEAVVEFALNDSLTSFKVMGLAYSADRFGKGVGRIRATQDIMTFNGTAPVVRTGDEFEASFTLKNITSEEKLLRYVIGLDGKPLKEAELKLAAGASERVAQKIPVFKEQGAASYTLTLFEGTKKIDELKVKQTIIPLLRPEVAFSDLKALDPEAEVPAQSDEHLVKVDLNLSSTLLPGPEALREFMRNYEYHCLEQDFARAVILEDDKLKQKIDRELSSYTDDRGFLKFYPAPEEKGHLFLSSHLLEVSHLVGWKLRSEGELESALARFIRGETKNLLPWEQKHFKELRLKAMVTLKLRQSSQFDRNWLSDVSAAAPSDTVGVLLQKWVLFHPGVGAVAAQELIRQKIRIDGSQVTLDSGDDEVDSIFSLPRSSLFVRFLLIQKRFPISSDFSTFYQENEGKFLRGLMGLRTRDHFGDTLSNTWAFVLERSWPQASVSGVTSIAGKQVTWKKDDAPTLFLSKEEAAKEQVIVHKGKGSPWVDVRYVFTPDMDKEASQGFTLNQNVRKLEGDGAFRVQDRLEATVTIDAKEDRGLLGMRLPLPAGSTVISAEMENGSYLSFEERTEYEWRGYFSWLPRGQHTIRVKFRLNQPGHFSMPGTRIEALYSPDVFAYLPYWEMNIQ